MIISCHNSIFKPWPTWFHTRSLGNSGFRTPLTETKTHTRIHGAHTQNKMMRVSIIVESIIVIVGLATKYIS